MTRLWLQLICCLLFWSGLSIADTRYQSVLQNTLTHYIVPAYAELTQATGLLQQQIDTLCDDPSGKHLMAAQQAFQTTVQAWSGVEWFRLGPVMEAHRVERFFFFPDRKSIGLRQVQAALIRQDSALLDPHHLPQQSIALQGIGALDYLLFGTGADTLQTQGGYRCRLAGSISQNLYQIATHLHTDWQQNATLRADWLHPTATNPLFRTGQAAMNRFIGLLIHGLEAIRDTRLQAFLRATPQQDRPKSAPLWRSQATLALITDGLTGLQRLFEQSQITMLLPPDMRQLANNIQFEFAQSIRVAHALSATPVATLLSNPAQRDQLLQLQRNLQFLINRLNHELAPRLGLMAGFSFGDGD